MYYIYCHKDLEGIPFYYGKSTKNSYRKDGFSRAYLSGGRGVDWKNKSKEGYTVEILDESQNEEEILLQELKYIQECETCVNKISRSTTIEYCFIKINENLCILHFRNYKENKFLLFSNGDIFNMSGLKIKPLDNGKGYKSIGINVKYSANNYTCKYFYIHRLVAEAFIENSKNKKVVHHKDENKANNDVSNLEWVTHQENVLYSLKPDKFITKAILKLDNLGNLVKSYNSVSEAAIEMECTEELLQSCASKNNLKCETGKGYLWVYEEDFNDDNNKLKFLLEKYKYGFYRQCSPLIKQNIREEFLNLKNNFKTKNKLIMYLVEKYNLSKRTIYIECKEL